jgi:hypothetical protein
MLAEHDESPRLGPQSTLDSIVSSPVPATPATAGRIQPARAEMHPSRAHHSTTKEPDSGLRLGFTDIDTSKNAAPLGTPSKIGISSSFDFTFAREGNSLGPEAQKLMDELREEAMKIKASLQAERAEEMRKNGPDISTLLAGRKIAQPKGKAGRFSDVHIAEFKKMDSIANHPSAFRVIPGRVPAAAATPKPSLKRTQSKAKLDDRDAQPSVQSIRMVPPSSRLENDAPAKRSRQIGHVDASSARPVSRDKTSNIPTPTPSTPSLARSKSSFLDAITTPTQASIARNANAKQSASQIPRSPSKFSLTPGFAKSKTTNNIAGLSKSESSHKFFDAGGKYGRMKSILRNPMGGPPKQAVAQPTSIHAPAKSPFRPNLEKPLPSVPATPGGLQRSKSLKHVNFTPATIMQDDATPIQSPTPAKSGISSGIPRSKTATNLPSIKYPNLTSKVLIPAISKNTRDTVSYPTLPQDNRPLTLAKQSPKASETELPPTVPGMFTFRSNQTVKFGDMPKEFGSSPGQATIRKVRPSIFSAKMPGAFPEMIEGNKENKAPRRSAVAHGLTNKKRARETSDDELDEEPEPSPKKFKRAEGMSMAPVGMNKELLAKSPAPKLMAQKVAAEKMAMKSQIPSPAKKGGLSLSRLKQLAMPKSRR